MDLGSAVFSSLPRAIKSAFGTADKTTINASLERFPIVAPPEERACDEISLAKLHALSIRNLKECHRIATWACKVDNVRKADPHIFSDIQALDVKIKLEPDVVQERRFRDSLCQVMIRSEHLYTLRHNVRSR